MPIDGEEGTTVDNPGVLIDGLRIGVLYESDEWSDHKLASEIERSLSDRGAQHGEACLIDMEGASFREKALACDVLVSRIFASGQFRGHSTSLKRAPLLMEEAERAGKLVLNPRRAHMFEVSKQASTNALAMAHVMVPRVYGCDRPSVLDPASFSYPCIIKPDCGGRTTHTFLAKSADEAASWLEQAPDIVFIVEEYIKPERGFLTRVEIVGSKPTLIVKRSIAENGLSAYRLGSTYERYEDCSFEIREAATHAAAALDFVFGSFDIIETRAGAYFIDANSVSNVSEDCTELFHYDLMQAHAQEICRLSMKQRS